MSDVAEQSGSFARRPRLRTMSLAELERVRLILRGGSVVDWYRLLFDSIDQARAFMRLQGGDPDDPADQARLHALREVATRYLQDEHAYRVPAELHSCDPLELFLYASEKRGRRRDRFFACLLLKTMHIVHHIEARELRFRAPLSQSRLADLLADKVDTFARQLRAEGFALVRYSGGEKSLSSLVTKLLVKKEHHAATIHDRVRFRFVVDHPFDIVELLVRMTERLFPYNYVAPGQTVNGLVNFTAMTESHPELRAIASGLQVGLGHEEAALPSENEFSGPSYRVVSVVADVPIRVPDDVLANIERGTDLGRVVFGLAELQMVDRAADDENERGENRHDRYRARQLLKVRDRLERGMRGVREDEP
ncbi:MAG: hypothetical protein A2138_01730 [Deltaproteobacteria bacterium RBG_16_71_12]|nr:MAG: hypothetical protein A2138_01730 [Deltaproteobacteria bacterium RBG_16_71_12]